MKDPLWRIMDQPAELVLWSELIPRDPSTNHNVAGGPWPA